MWHTFLEWFGTIGGIVAFLHFFFPKQGARAGDYILNRFAERSKSSLKKRIEHLEETLAKKPVALRMFLVTFSVRLSGSVFWLGSGASLNYFQSVMLQPFVRDPKCTLCKWLITPDPATVYPNWNFYITTFATLSYLMGMLFALNASNYSMRALANLSIEATRASIALQLEDLRQKLELREAKGSTPPAAI